jgi:hypothetical protein
VVSFFVDVERLERFKDLNQLHILLIPSIRWAICLYIKWIILLEVGKST